MNVDPGPLAGEKLSEHSEPGQPEPQAAEIESARLLANQAGPALRRDGLADEDRPLVGRDGLLHPAESSPGAPNNGSGGSRSSWTGSSPGLRSLDAFRR